MVPSILDVGTLRASDIDSAHSLTTAKVRTHTPLCSKETEFKNIAKLDSQPIFYTTWTPAILEHSSVSLYIFNGGTKFQALYVPSLPKLQHCF